MPSLLKTHAVQPTLNKIDPHTLVEPLINPLKSQKLQALIPTTREALTANQHWTVLAKGLSFYNFVLSEPLTGEGWSVLSETPSALPSMTIVPAPVFDDLLAALAEPPRAIPELVEAVRATAEAPLFQQF